MKIACSKLTKGAYSITVSLEPNKIQHYEAWKMYGCWEWGESIEDYTALGCTRTLKDAKKAILNHALN